MNKIKLKFRTKIEAGIVLSVVMFFLFATAFGSVTRTITDESDNIETFIRNSNGNYYSATTANIQVALDDCQSTGGLETDGYGVVELPANTTFTFDSGDKIDMPEGTMLRCNGAIFSVASGGASNPYIIYMTQVTFLQDLHIDAHLNFAGSCIYINGSDPITYNYQLGVKNVHMLSGDWISGSKGIEIHSNGAGEYCTFATFEDCRTYGFNYGFYLRAEGGSSPYSYVNSNTFINCWSASDVYGFYIYGGANSANEVSGNLFINCGMQPNSASHTETAIYIRDKARGNTFTNFKAWDASYFQDVIYNISSILYSYEPRDNYIQGSNIFENYFDNYIHDNGTYNHYYGTTSGSLLGGGIREEPIAIMYNVNISTLILRPRTRVPDYPVEGMMYYDDTYNKLRLYDSTGWVNVTVS